MGRQVAQLISSLKELTWHVMQVQTDMREIWIGVPGRPGASVLGDKWLRALEDRQKRHSSM
jgi:hypothetical protein